MRWMRTMWCLCGRPVTSESMVPGPSAPRSTRLCQPTFTYVSQVTFMHTSLAVYMQPAFTLHSISEHVLCLFLCL